MEAGTHSPWVSRVVAALGHETIVANPRRLRAIYDNDDKADSVDAEYLARVGRADPRLLRGIQHRGEQAQADLAVVRARDALVRTRTLLINHTRGVVKAMGGRLPNASAEAFARKARGHLPPAPEPALGPVLQHLERLTQVIRVCDRQLEQLRAERYSETMVLRQIGGVGTKVPT
jgi:transposase